MTNREHFIAILQACYFGDRNAFEEIIRIYDEKENIIKGLDNTIQNLEEVMKQKENIIKEVREYVDKWEDISRYKLLEILDKENK